LSNENQPRLLSFTLDGWDVLGGKVSVSLSDRVAVLVGRNGAGKSAILEGFEDIASFAMGNRKSKFIQIRQNNINNFPKILDIEILTPTNRRLSYHYELISLPINVNNFQYVEGRQFSWSDCCQYVDGEKEKLLETLEGLTTFENGTNQVIGGTSSFDYKIRPMKHFQLPTEMEWVFTVINGVHIIGDIPANQVFERHSSLLRTSGGFTEVGTSLSDELSLEILNLDKRGELHEVESICQRIGLGDKVTIQKFINKESGENGENFISLVLLDEVNVGLLSNGTLRVLSILIEIVSLQPGSTIIIEEPELQIHPGMLEKLLNEIEAYTFGENLILSTHSPQVVSWAKPDKINLVCRDNGKTSIRKLSENEIHRVIKYLNEDGDLGGWIYSGILDD
jgi:AAA domain, putative AbiEii toxin, Type IV TA system